MKKNYSKKTIQEMGYLYVYREEILKGFLVLLALAGIMGGCSYLNRSLGMEDDNPIEQMIEQIIEEKTGIDLDLTP